MKNTTALTTLLLASAIAPTSQATSTNTLASTTPAIYSFESDGNGFNTKNFFLDTGQEVVVFDAQFTAENAQKSLEFIQSKTKNPIRYVVITHPNPDKFNGAAVFQKIGAKVVASQATAAAIAGVHAYKKYYFVEIAKMFSNETYPNQAVVDITFDKNYSLPLLGNFRVSLRELAHPGVSSNQTIAEIPALSAVIVGDLVHHQAHAWLEGGIVGGNATPTLAGWIADLQALAIVYRNKPDTLVYGGRGEVAKLNIAVAEQVSYLKKADAIVDDYLKALGSTAKAELTGPNAGKHYSAITMQFVKAFPQYALSYMIEYGVYGLVNSKL
jgi:glyoxylase-like metal-dependent hydrolase (beta-lactamase superfamily II)